MEDEDPFGIIGGSKESLDQLIQSGCGLSYSWNSPFTSRPSSIFTTGTENSFEQKSPPSGDSTAGGKKKTGKKTGKKSSRIKFKKSFEREVLEREAELSVSNDDFDSQNPVACDRHARENAFRLDICDNCGGLVNQKNGVFQCSECGKMVEIEFVPETTTEHQIGTRMKIVGPGNKYFQRGLDSMASGDYGEIQKQTILNEFMNYNRVYIEKGGDGFAMSVIQKAADMYHEIQKRVVRRDQQKVKLMGACLKRSCIESGFSRLDRDIIDCVGLRSGGLTKGEDFLRSMASSGEISMEFDDIREYEAQITTVLATVGVMKDKHEKYESLRNLIMALVKTAEDNNIANSSLLKTKVVGTAFVILAHHGSEISFSAFCQNCKIRTNTVKKFIVSFEKFHSKFEPVLLKHDLEPKKPTEFPTVKKIFATRANK